MDGVMELQTIRGPVFVPDTEWKFMPVIIVKDEHPDWCGHYCYDMIDRQGRILGHDACCGRCQHEAV